MTRLCLALVGGLLLVSPTWGDDPGVKGTIAYVQKLQTPDGGFVASVDKAGTPTLRATSSGVRTLHYLGGTVPDRDAAARFVSRCFDPSTGGFADTPGGTPDVSTTAVGVMAMTELKLPADKYGPPAAKFLTERAKTFEEIRIAAAGFESLGQEPPRADEWVREIRKTQNPDGTFGKAGDVARATGGAAAALLRLGIELKERDAVLKALRDGQRGNGGYGKADSPIASDLETTYRVMRSFMMLKEQPPSVEGVRSFLAKCRNEDGGYGVVPGQPSSLSGTYYAAIIRYWLDRKD